MFKKWVANRSYPFFHIYIVADLLIYCYCCKHHLYCSCNSFGCLYCLFSVYYLFLLHSENHSLCYCLLCYSVCFHSYCLFQTCYIPPMIYEFALFFIRTYILCFSYISNALVCYELIICTFAQNYTMQNIYISGLLWKHYPKLTICFWEVLFSEKH